MYTHTYNELISLKPVPRLFTHRLHVSLLHKEVAPVGQIEPSIDGVEGDSADDIDLFEGPRGKLVEPELQKVIVLLWLFFL